MSLGSALTAWTALAEDQRCIPSTPVAPKLLITSSGAGGNLTALAYDSTCAHRHTPAHRQTLYKLGTQLLLGMASEGKVLIIDMRESTVRGIWKRDEAVNRTWPADWTRPREERDGETKRGCIAEMSGF